MEVCHEKILPFIALLLSLTAGSVMAAEKPNASMDDAYAAAKSAEIETMRVRLGTNPSINATTTLIETENLLRQFQSAPPAQKNDGFSIMPASQTKDRSPVQG